MEPLTVDAALLRALETPELRLAPGRSVMARVVAQEAGRGQIAIAGAKLDAQLPAHLRAGDELRLTVKEVSADRVVLSMSPPTSAPVDVPAPARPRPEDSDAEHEQAAPGASPPGTHVVALRYPAPALGPVDLRFELDESALRITVALAPGMPLTAAQAAIDELRGAVAEATSRAVSVAVIPRREPLDVYA